MYRAETPCWRISTTGEPTESPPDANPMYLAVRVALRFDLRRWGHGPAYAADSDSGMVGARGRARHDHHPGAAGRKGHCPSYGAFRVEPAA